MMLDPLTAFATAVNAIQLAELGVQVLRKAHEVRTGVKGLTKEQAHLESLVHHLQTTLESLEGTTERKDQQALSDEAQCLQQASHDCASISKDFLTLLDSFKVKDTRDKWDVFKQAIRALWNEKDVREMERQLVRAREKLNLSLMVYLKQVSFLI